jgi:hypothetical protein
MNYQPTTNQKEIATVSDTNDSKKEMFQLRMDNFAKENQIEKLDALVGELTRDLVNQKSIVDSQAYALKMEIQDYQDMTSEMVELKRKAELSEQALALLRQTTADLEKELERVGGALSFTENNHAALRTVTENIRRERDDLSQHVAHLKSEISELKAKQKFSHLSFQDMRKHNRLERLEEEVAFGPELASGSMRDAADRLRKVIHDSFGGDCEMPFCDALIDLRDDILVYHEDIIAKLQSDRDVIHSILNETSCRLKELSIEAVCEGKLDQLLDNFAKDLVSVIKRMIARC